MTHAAEQWSSIDVDKRPKFVKEIFQKHQLLIISADKKLPEMNSKLPYLYFLKLAIEKHQGLKMQFKQSYNKNNGIEWFWVDIPINNQIVRIGFQHDRIGVQPPLALTIVMLVGLLVTLITAILLTRRLTIPVERLYQAAEGIGKAQWPAPIKEEGPEELKVLAQTFNRMNKKVKELLNNRTTLLAGIAHDLRTPLTQIQLALEMLPNNGGDNNLMDSIRDDLKTINDLISESLNLGIEFTEQKKEEIDLIKEFKKTINHYPNAIINTNLQREKLCIIRIEILTLRRIINNLLENAIRYGNNNPIDLSCYCNKNNIQIMIEDRGSGIPKEKAELVFQPFYRLEQSRGSGTGGSGLGLAIVKQLSDSHSWDISLMPRKGGGTTAIVKIPYNK